MYYCIGVLTHRGKKKMAKLASSLSFLTLFIVVLLQISRVVSQEVEDEREFDYNPNGQNGPSRWGELHHDWGACNNGSLQSPIDLLHERVQLVSHLGRLHRSYKCSNATLKNRGHDMMLQWEGGAGTLRINGTDYALHQCHWHSPSEHTIDGKRFDLELHMVHESLDGKVAVVGIMYTIGRPDSFLSTIESHLKSVAGSLKRGTAVGFVDPRDIKIGGIKYYRYFGSLTIPPCTENVLWSIVRKVRTVSREQLRLLRVAVHDDSDTNARPVQPTNDRWLKLYRPDQDEEKDD